MTGLSMLDSILNDQFMPGADAYAAYVDGQIGNQPNFSYVVAAFPKAHHLSIALFPDHDADAIDVENGAADADDVPGWTARQRKRGIARPVVYASAYEMNTEVLPVLHRAGIGLSSVRLWTAHYNGEHICGPAGCGQLSVNADGTQWTSAAQGRALDQSLLLANFFGTPKPAPTPAANWTEKIVQQLPEVKQGATGSVVRTVQGLCCARDQVIKVDGVFGPATATAVKKVQAAARIAQDGVVGPATWPALVGVA